MGHEGRTDQDERRPARQVAPLAARCCTGKAPAARIKSLYNVSIAAEREVILMMAQNDRKAVAIMQSVLHHAGPDSEAGATLFSLPVSEVADLA